MNIVVAQSGGPTSVINASLLGVYRAASEWDSVDTVYGSLNGIEGILNTGIEQLRRMHQRIHGRIHFQSALQICTGEPYFYQLTFRTNTQGCCVENIGYRYSADGYAFANDTGGRQRHIHLIAQGIRSSLAVGIGEQIAQGGLVGIVIDFIHIVEFKGIMSQHLVEGHITADQVLAGRVGMEGVEIEATFAEQLPGHIQTHAIRTGYEAIRVGAAA